MACATWTMTPVRLDFPWKVERPASVARDRASTCSVRSLIFPYSSSLESESSSSVTGRSESFECIVVRVFGAST